jgi:hypothetical protein
LGSQFRVYDNIYNNARYNDKIDCRRKGKFFLNYCDFQDYFKSVWNKLDLIAFSLVVLFMIIFYALILNPYDIFNFLIFVKEYSNRD